MTTTKAKCWFLNGACIHIGEWQSEMVPVIERREFTDGVTGEKRIAEIVKGRRDAHPVPEGATSFETDVVETEHGIFVASDYARLRQCEYPKVEDQLDALWKGGADTEAMRERVMAVKAKYPKPE